MIWDVASFRCFDWKYQVKMVNPENPGPGPNKIPRFRFRYARDLKRPTFFSEAIIAAFPLFSLPAYFFLIIFFIIDKTDEFQLLFFILQVRGMQFLSDGFLQVAWFFEGCDVLWRPYLVVKRWYLIRVLCRVSQSVAWGVRLCSC